MLYIIYDIIYIYISYILLLYKDILNQLPLIKQKHLQSAFNGFNGFNPQPSVTEGIKSVKILRADEAFRRRTESNLGPRTLDAFGQKKTSAPKNHGTSKTGGLEILEPCRFKPLYRRVQWFLGWGWFWANFSIIPKPEVRIVFEDFPCLTTFWKWPWLRSLSFAQDCKEHLSLQE